MERVLMNVQGRAQGGVRGWLASLVIAGAVLIAGAVESPAEKLFNPPKGSKTPNADYVILLNVAEEVCKLQAPDHDMVPEVLAGIRETGSKSVGEFLDLVEKQTAIYALALATAGKLVAYCEAARLTFRGF